jgi:hypothetical protein
VSTLISRKFSKIFCLKLTRKAIGVSGATLNEKQLIDELQKSPGGQEINNNPKFPSQFICDLLAQIDAI